MKNQDNFYVSKRSRQGVYVLICIGLFIVFVPRLYELVSPSPKIFIEAKEIDQLKTAYRKNVFKGSSNYAKRHKYRSPPHAFDPNVYSLKDWMYLGLSEKQAAVVIRFTARGIQSDDELSKIFVIPKALFEQIKDSTFYVNAIREPVKDKSTSSKKSLSILVEVNGATQEQLETIPGVGTFYAKNIIRYRDRLGGFIRKEQLLEVWKMDESKYSEIIDFISIDLNGLRKINLNTVTAEELKAHPYLNWNTANSILKIRTRKGGFKSVEEIKESILVNEEVFIKLKPYVSL